MPEEPENGFIMTDDFKIRIKATGQNCTRMTVSVNETEVFSIDSNSIDYEYDPTPAFWSGEETLSGSDATGIQSGANAVNTVVTDSSGIASFASTESSKTFMVDVTGHGSLGRVHSAKKNVVVKEKSVHRVTFNYMGGSGSPDFIDVNARERITLPDAVLDDKHICEGWYSQAADGSRMGLCGGTFMPWCDITLFAKWEEKLTVDNMLDKFENDTTYRAKHSDFVDDDKWGTLISIGRALANSNYESAFIAGFIGHITREGNIGLFYGQYGNILTKTIPEIKEIAAMDKAFGCCQWKEGRLSKLLEFYDQYHSGNSANFYSLDEATKAEQNMVNYELSNSYQDPSGSGLYNYKFVHSEWIEECNEEGISVDSERAAYLAGYRIIIGYGLSTYRRNESRLGSWISEAEIRGNYAIDAYRAMSETHD